MGNSTPQPNQLIKHQIFLSVPKKQILPIRHKPNPKAIPYGQTLRDSSILLGRFIFLNPDKFQGQSVLQLSAGTGFVSIVVSNYTKAKNITVTESDTKTIEELNYNLKQNKAVKVKIEQLSLKQYQKLEQKYEVLLIADPFAQNCQPELLVNISNFFLVDKGTLFISAPNDGNLKNFYNQLQSSASFTIKKCVVSSEQYTSSPLKDKKDGSVYFSKLMNNEITLCSVTKNVVKVQEVVKQQKVEIPQPIVKQVVSAPVLKQEKVQIINEPQPEIQKSETKTQSHQDELSTKVEQKLPESESISPQVTLPENIQPKIEVLESKNVQQSTKVAQNQPAVVEVTNQNEQNASEHVVEKAEQIQEKNVEVNSVPVETHEADIVENVTEKEQINGSDNREQIIQNSPQVSEEQLPQQKQNEKNQQNSEKVEQILPLNVEVQQTQEQNHEQQSTQQQIQQQIQPTQNEQLEGHPIQGVPKQQVQQSANEEQIAQEPINQQQKVQEKVEQHQQLQEEEPNAIEEPKSVKQNTEQVVEETQNIQGGQVVESQQPVEKQQQIVTEPVQNIQTETEYETKNQEESNKPELQNQNQKTEQLVEQKVEPIVQVPVNTEPDQSKQVQQCKVQQGHNIQEEQVEKNNEEVEKKDEEVQNTQTPENQNQKLVEAEPEIQQQQKQNEQVEQVENQTDTVQEFKKEQNEIVEDHPTQAAQKQQQTEQTQTVEETQKKPEDKTDLVNSQSNVETEDLTVNNNEETEAVNEDQKEGEGESKKGSKKKNKKKK